MNDESVSVAIPKEVFDNICQAIRNTDPNAVSKYVTYLIKKELARTQKNIQSNDDKTKIKERLSKLGYF